MKLTPRKYQTEAKEAVISEWEKGNKKTLIVLPTGTGKTIVFTDILDTVLTEGKRALVLAHTGELLEQAIDKIERFSNLGTSLEKASKTAVGSEKPVVVGSIQTLSRDKRLHQFPPDYFQYIIVDEAHHCLSDSYQKVLKYFGEACVLGVTATPNRGDQKKLSDFFDSKAYEYEFKQAIKDGYLCPIRTETLSIQIDIKNVRMQNGDFAVSDIDLTLNDYLESIAKTIKQKCEHRKTVVFLPLIATAKKFSAMLNEIGVPAAEISGESLNRVEILDGFKNGKYKVLCNAMLLTEGWDCPEVDCIIVLRPTRSDTLYRQMCGRGCRLAEGKKNLLLLDFLWLSKKMDLMRPARLVGTDENVIEKMTRKAKKKGTSVDLLELEAEAEKAIQDEIEAKPAKELREAAERKRLRERNKRAVEIVHRVGDLFGAEELQDFKHYSPWERMSPTSSQLKALKKFGLEEEHLDYLTKGAAHILISFFIKRKENGLCTYRQAIYLKKNGEEDTLTISFKAASDKLDKLFARRR